MRRPALLLAGARLLLGCSAEPPAGVTPPATAAILDLGADLSRPEVFYDVPYPSDLRLTARGTPDLTGFPYPSFVGNVASLLRVAVDHPGFPVVPVAYFRFSAPLAPLDVDAVIPADKASPILLIDIDETSDRRGELLPTVAATPPEDPYVPPGLLAVAPRPGVVLHPDRKYAVVVTGKILDAAGGHIDPSPALRELRSGRTPAGAKGAVARELYAPLWPVLDAAGVDRADVIAATVFTTGDVVADLSTLTTALLARYNATISDLHVDPDDGASHDRYCELLGKVRLPQFQEGMPPFNTGGLFDFSDGGLPRKQRDEEVPFVISLPKGPMPTAGYPLALYFHGSGGLSSALVDRGRWVPESDPSKCPEGTTETWMGVEGCNTKGEGPAYTLAPRGIAMAGSALPVNPERVPGAKETAYLNLDNLAAGRDVFRQGVIEQRLFLAALTQLEISPSTLGACTGLTLPPGASSFHFDADRIVAQGQSMGGQYANLISAVEPRIRAVVPTGAGGYWSHFILITPLFPAAAGKVALILATKAHLTFLHPAMQLFETAWEAVDPIVYAPRLARRPLKAHPVRPIYEPVALGDSYFPEPTYDAMALAYAHREAGDVIWPSMQEALALEHRDGIVPYPVKGELLSETGAQYTGVVIQYRGDGVYDPHAIFSQLDAVKHQYACFFSTLLTTGAATVPAPSPPDDACPQ